MKIRYIGTGAADWTEAAGSKDGEQRRFSAACLDGELMIDLAPTTPMSLFLPGASLECVQSVIYTHSHNDHYCERKLSELCAERPITVCADAAFAARLPHLENLTVVSISAGETKQVGRYSVLALPANHAVSAHPEEQPLHFVISDGDKRIFWGADGAWLFTDTWQAIRKHRPYDRMILDGTLGDGIGDDRIFEHNNLRMVREMANTFRDAGCLTSAGQIWITHLSRDAHVGYEELCARLTPDGIRVAADETEDEF